MPDLRVTGSSLRGEALLQFHFKEQVIVVVRSTMEEEKSFKLMASINHNLYYSIMLHNFLNCLHILTKVYNSLKGQQLSDRARVHLYTT